MGVDFRITLRMTLEDLKKLLRFRKGRLNDVADEHFRERLSEFFRRYPYDEWYPLNLEELNEYKKGNPDIELLPWQKNWNVDNCS